MPEKPEMFFPRLRTHARFMFWALAIVFLLMFVGIVLLSLL